MATRTVTVTTTVTEGLARRNAVHDFAKDITIAARQASATPIYASACSGASRYSSACSCWGFTATTTTGPTFTQTVTSTATATASPAPPDCNAADYGCSSDYISRSGYGYQICPAAYDLKCGQLASSDADAKIINPPASQPNLANGYQYCDFECKRRRTCFGFSYTYRTDTCTLFENSDGSHGSYVLTPDPCAISAELLPDCAPYACPEDTTCPLEA
jgi:hypothetical protein